AAPTRALRARRIALAVILLHRAEHLDEQLLLLVRHRRRFDLRDRFLDELLALIAAEHLPAHGLHHVLREHAAHHRELRRLRRIVQQLQLRLLAVAEERAAGRVAEAWWNDDGDRDPSPPDEVARLLFGRLRDAQVLVGLRARDDRLRDRAAVLIDDRD